jgi:hypothetical protein
MTKTSWSHFLGEHPGGHIVVADVDAGDEGSTARADFGGGRHLMRQLIDKLEPTGTYAIGVQRKGDAGNICCAFSNRADADRLADAVRARSIGRWSGWASQRVFTLDGALRAAIAAALATQGEVDARRAAECSSDDDKPTERRPAERRRRRG